MDYDESVTNTLADLNSLRDRSEDTNSQERLRAALSDRSNLVVERAAEIIGDAGLHEFTSDLCEALQRFYQNPVKRDPGCKAKTAIMIALVNLDWGELEVYREAISYHQFEPVWGGREDTAAHLRGAAAAGLVGCASITEALNRFADLLADPCRPARIGAARAIAGLGHPEGGAILRLKIHLGDAEPEVVGEVCSALLQIQPEEAFDLVVAQLNSTNLDICVQAALALGESRRKEAFEPLRARWEHTVDLSIRGMILTSIGLLRHTEAIEFLLSLVGQQEVNTSIDAIRALKPYAVMDDVRTRLIQAVEKAAEPRLQKTLDSIV